jgi:hypothetical protein
MLIVVIFRVEFVFDTGLWEKMIGYSLQFLIAGLIGYINDAFDKILLRRLVI